MKKYFYLVVIFELFLISCGKSRDEEIKIDGFETYEKLSGSRLKSSDQIMRVNLMDQIGDFLYAVDPDSTHVISIIDIEEDRLVKRFGRIGQGPCEMDRIVSVMRVPKNPNRVGFYCFRRFTYFEFDKDHVLGENIREDAPCELQIRNFDQDFNKVINVGGNKFLGMGYFDKKYALTDNDSPKSSRYFLDYHFQDQFVQEHKNRSLSMAAQGDLVLKPDGSRTIFGARNFIGFDILSVSENGDISLIKRLEHTPPIFSMEGNEQNFSVDFSEENVFGYKKTVANDQFIYALFSGKKNKRYHPSNLVLVYDWDGNPVKKNRTG